MSYTKGEWILNQDFIYKEDDNNYTEDRIDIEQTNATGKPHLGMICIYNSDRVERNANSKLIAAAPDLLKACMDICNADTAFKLKEARELCKTVIKKATL